MKTLFLSTPPRVTFDLRSLAVFRFLLGAYLLYDLYSRLLLGKYNLHWYLTSEENGFLEASDTPHGATLHKLWFYRGSALLQILLFAFTAVLAVCFTVGFCCNGTMKTLLWILVVSYQNRNMHVHDGSDAFLRHVLVWSCFLPLDKVWSVDVFRKNKGYTNYYQIQYSSLATLALALQICLMYWGTVAHRTIDLFTLSELYKSEWMPPQLTAVHYAMSGTFATRKWWLPDLIRTHATLSRVMTCAAMLGETLLPLGCLVDSKRRHVYAALLVQLHVGLALTLNLPNWQYLGILVQAVWIPTHVWEYFISDMFVVYHKKTDNKDASSTMRRPNAFSRFAQRFLFVYMIYNWCGNRNWIPKHDRGDIGEGLRLSQYWVMFNVVGHEGQHVFATGLVQRGEGTVRRLDLWHFIRTGYIQPQLPIDFVPQDMSSRYPSPRWERAVSTGLFLTPNTRRWEHFGKALCRLVNQDLKAMSLSPIDAIEWRHQYLSVLGPGASRRYSESQDDIVELVECDL
jgi:hypothetical protein